MIRRLLDRILRATGINPEMLSACWWCGHPETHDDDTGCQHPGCACTGLL